MYNLIERYIYLLIFSIEILAMEQLSPCPEYFRYFWNDRNEIMGGVEIPSPPKYGKIRLELELSLAASLPSKYFGRIELFKSKDESARDIHQGRPLFYVVHFPLTSPLPVLTKLWLNGELYCTGPPTSGRYITTITLIYTLIPSRTLLTSADFDIFLGSSEAVTSSWLDLGPGVLLSI
ncbi:hypothetical protein M0802_008487 [Mischocyttarus mexicanus]|nr:hypothetical protein M0802_008487 [Mischocyttarus mexicanus]